MAIHGLPDGGSITVYEQAGDSSWTVATTDGITLFVIMSKGELKRKLRVVNERIKLIYSGDTIPEGLEARLH
ncbi:MAG: hypothetical protein LBS61_04895 [Endomicrobium sp.]|jgi:hypothetical protein|nr:hypothetical protein [Endomicrobium sp.]